MNTNCIQKTVVRVGDWSIHYRWAGSGAPVILLHGWPTSSHLWRHVLPQVAAAGKWAIAPDLLGFGESDKPASVTYTLRLHAQILDGFIKKLGIEKTSLVVHDLGGPIGLRWAIDNPHRVERIAVTNTIAYPQPGLLLGSFMLAARIGVVGRWLSGPSGIASCLKLGTSRKTSLTPAVLQQYINPFEDRAAQKVLLKTLLDMPKEEMVELASKLSTLASVPSRIFWGKKDSLLPFSHARWLQRDWPSAQYVELSANHFLQEDDPMTLGKLLQDFLG